MTHETVIQFQCDGSLMRGILHHPREACSRGVIILPGGRQYRVGHHRLFVSLARALADNGVAVLRFDYRGTGDSDGDTFGVTDRGTDIAAAIDAFQESLPELDEFVLWGLCDGATAGLLYAAHDIRVKGIVLANPWIITDEGRARSRLKHYYLRRLLSRDLWSKIARGEFQFLGSTRSLISDLYTGLAKRPRRSGDSNAGRPDQNGQRTSEQLKQSVLESVRAYQGDVLLILSGSDPTARIFMDTLKSSGLWRSLLASPRTAKFDLPDANHVFARQDWTQCVITETCDWVMKSAHDLLLNSSAEEKSA